MQWPSSRLSHDYLMAELQWQCAHVLKACMTPGNLDLFLDYFVSFMNLACELYELELCELGSGL